MPTRRPILALAAGLTLLLLVAGIGRIAAGGGGKGAAARRLNTHAMALAMRSERGPGKGSREAGERKGSGSAQEAYDNRALPRKYVSNAQARANLRAFDRMRLAPQHRRAQTAGRTPAKVTTTPTWQELGPVTATVPALATYTNRATTVSGRVTALAIGPSCVAGNCPLYVAAAGGGIWKTTNALASQPAWTDKTDGLASNAIGSLAVDPKNANVIWAGTGEPSGSSDSEAGVGLYRSTNGGNTWSLIPSSVAISRNRGIGTIAIDPTNSSHILIGTDVARHGSSSVNGGRFTPPNSPKLAVYESKNGGSTWTKALQLPQDTVDPNSATGNDFFAGGITKILFDPNSAGTVYASSFTWGLWRRIGSGPFQQIFHALNPGDTFERAEFALAKMAGGKTRIWAGTGDFSDPCCAALLWRVDDASLPAANLLATQDTPNPTAKSWHLLSAGAINADGDHVPIAGKEAAFTSFDFCQDQCSYDIGVWSPPKGPNNIIVLQGAMQYEDIFGGPPYSNGATTVRSTNAGGVFSDMTNDALSPPNGLHPDHRAVVFDPNNPNIMFLGSDGGVTRVGPSYVDQSSTCAGRGLTGAGLKACQYFLKAVPAQIFSLNDGLPTIQFQSVTINPQDPANDLIGGNQDNGTFAFDCSGGLPCTTFQSINGDGGQSAIDATTPTTRTHSYFNPYYDTNFQGNATLGWDWISDPFIDALTNGELFSFYPPLIHDPVTHGYEYTGGQYVYRTTDNGGSQAYLDQHCNEYTGDFAPGIVCGDWVKVSGDLTAGPSSDKGTGYIVTIERAPSDTDTMWVGTRRGRLYVSKNAHAGPAAVTYDRIDTTSQPRRFPSGISIDPANPNHAYISFSGYNAYTPTTPGHVFDVTYNPAAHSATWTDLSHNLGDQPITDIEYVQEQSTLYAATDFGVLSLHLGQTNWHQAAPGLPKGAVYALRQVPGSGLLYAATHGRGVFRLNVAPPRNLTVKLSGSGKGLVTSEPEGISCLADCDEQYDDGTQVTLGATAKKTSKFAGWSGDCSGKGDCALTMDKDHSVTAKFVRLCVVPKVKGKTLAKAKKALTRAKCKTGRITRRYSKAVQKGHVISQKPKPGAKRKKGAKVRLVVSKGKKPNKR
jgi:PASTA domain/Divergent InlB B-repeat domain